MNLPYVREMKTHEDGRKIWYYRTPDDVKSFKPNIHVVTGSHSLAVQIASMLALNAPVTLLGSVRSAIPHVQVLSNSWTQPEVWDLISHQHTIHTVYHLGPWDAVGHNEPDKVFSAIVAGSLFLMQTIKSLKIGSMVAVTPQIVKNRDKNFVTEAFTQFEHQLQYIARSHEWPYALVRAPGILEYNTNTMANPLAPVVEACIILGTQLATASQSCRQKTPGSADTHSDDIDEVSYRDVAWAVASAKTVETAALLKSAEIFLPTRKC